MIVSQNWIESDFLKYTHVPATDIITGIKNGPKTDTDNQETLESAWRLNKIWKLSQLR
jgi:hypothetical protein